MLYNLPHGIVEAQTKKYQNDRDQSLDTLWNTLDDERYRRNLINATLKISDEALGYGETFGLSVFLISLKYYGYAG